MKGKKYNTGPRINRKFSTGRIKMPLKELRFKVSLVILITVLIFSVNLLLLSLNGAFFNNKTSVSLGGTNEPLSNYLAPTAQSKAPSCVLNDDSIDFSLTIPKEMGDWIYKTGYVKSPVDNSLSNQYVQIYVPVPDKKNSNRFDDQNQKILTFRKFSKAEWKKLEKGCTENNSVYCEAVGTKLDEKDESVYAYTLEKACPKNIEAKCRLADQIVKSFQLK